MSKNKFKVVYKNNLFILNILFIYLKNIYLFIFNIFFQTFLGAKLSFSVLFFLSLWQAKQTWSEEELSSHTRS